MPALFQWPPVVCTRYHGSNNYYFAHYKSFYSNGSGGYKFQYPIEPNCQYFGQYNGRSVFTLAMSDRINGSEEWALSTLEANYTTVVEVPNGSMQGTEDQYSTYTTMNGVVVHLGSTWNLDVQTWFSPDNGVNARCAIVATSEAVNGNDCFLISGNAWPGTYAIQDTSYPASLDKVRIIQLNATKFMCMWETWSVGGAANWRYTVWDSVAHTYAAPANMPVVGNIAGLVSFDIYDAGENYFYFIYVHTGALYIYGVDGNTGVPVFSSPLGGTGVPGAYLYDAISTDKHNACRRFITFPDGTRCIALQMGNVFLRFTYSSADKTAITVHTSTRVPNYAFAASSSQHIFTLEFDPLASTPQLYMVHWSMRASELEGVQFFAEYIDALASTGNYANFVTVTATGPFYAFNTIFSGIYGSSSCYGEAGYGAMGATTADTNQNGLTTLISYRTWHTPAQHNLSVTIGSPQSSCTVSDRDVAYQRSLPFTNAYSYVTCMSLRPSSYIDRFSWMLAESSVYEYTVAIASTYDSVSLSYELVLVQECLPLNQNWENMGYTWMDDFMVYVNQDRAAVGLPRYKTWGEDGLYLHHIDVANLHASNIVHFDYYAHEGAAFPPNQQTVELRGDIMPSTGILENLLISSTQYLPTGYLNPTSPTGHISAYDAWHAWHISPGHYANIIYDWGSRNNVAYSLMGLEAGRITSNMGPGWAGSADWTFLYLVNNFVSLETRMFEIPLQQTWPNSGALISSLQQAWANDSWVHVAARHETGYSLRVASSDFSAVWGCRTAAQHEAPITYSAAAQMEHPYGATVQVPPQQHVAPYAVKNTQPVAQQSEAKYALRVLSAYEALWSVNVAARQQSEAKYGIYSTQPVAAQSEVKYGLSVAAQAQVDWAVNTTVRNQCTAPYGEVIPVRTQAQADYALLQNNPVRVSMAHYYAMQDYVSTLMTNNEVTLVLADGTTLRVDDGVIDSASGDVGYAFECSIADLSVFTNIKEDDPIVVNFCGELYNFVIKTKATTRGSPAEVVLRISADNAVARLGSPYAAEATYDQPTSIAASALVDSLIAIDFNYEIIDWTIPAGRLRVDGATPLEVISQVAEAAGGVVDGEPDGTMRIRYRYPSPMNALDSAVVDQTYTDSYDNLSMSTSTEYRDGATRFRVREGDSSFADVMEWVPDVVQADPVLQTGIVKAYLSPYRLTAQIGHLGNAVYMIPMGESIEYHEELVEFNEGVGNTGRPIDTLLSVDWITANMGAPAYAAYSTLLNVNPTVNKGYGLAKVRYNARHLTAAAGGVPANVPAGEVGPASSYAYFILEETNG